MTQKKSTGKGRGSKKSPKKQKKFSFLGLLFKLALVGALVLAGYMVYLDAVVQERFNGKRWTVPAQVYARPLELYAGQKLQLQDFQLELRALGYRDEAVERPGSMQVRGNEVWLHTRGFRFYEGNEPAQVVRVAFAGGRVSRLTDGGGRSLAVVRLDPLLIGGIYPAHQEDRILIRLDDTPGYLIQALTAVEDRDFFEHHGVSLRSIGRAIWVNTTSGQLRQGGSTLTQQLVKNFFLSNERKFKRKINEALMAILLELHYDKNEILETYLNEVFLGQDGRRAIHGFGLASQYYFGRPLAELEVQQVALLVGMVKGPSYYHPRKHAERTLERRNLVLDMLVEQGVISAEKGAAAKAKPLGITGRGSLANTTYPTFMDLVKRQLQEDYRDQDLTEEGLRIFTSFDPVVQIKAEQALETTYKQLSGRSGIADIEAALVVTHPSTGEVQALLGSRRPRFAGFNRALDAKRPIGSLVKPAIYLTALQQPQRYSLTTLLQDRSFSVRSSSGKDWTPQNYDRKEHGTIFLYQGLAQSYNLSTARLGMETGIPEVLQTVRQLGAEHDWPAYPAMLLGAGSLTPLQVAQMYQTLASGGFHTPMRAIRNVLTADGDPLGRYPLRVEQRFEGAPVYLVREGLRRAMTEGTGRSALSRLPAGTHVAGKTGTSNDLRDSWFAGFSEDTLAVVWMGRDDNGKTSLTGATGALQLWSELMKSVRPESLSMRAPEGIVEAWVDPVEGLAVEEPCEGTFRMPYAADFAPPLGSFCAPEAAEELPEQVLPGDVQETGKRKGWLRGWLKR